MGKRQDQTLSVTDLVCGYGAEPICGPATFELHPGEAAVILGANGAGKTTLLGTIAGRQHEISG